MKKMILLATVLILSGCSYTMQLMPRDGGTLYQGQIKSNGAGGGALSIGLDGRTCAGNFVTVASGDTFGLAQTFGSHGTTNTTFGAFAGHAQYKAMLSCSDNTGLRCDVSGSSTNGGGICVDSKNRVYDMIYS
jgi:hypothetical protein